MPDGFNYDGFQAPAGGGAVNMPDELAVRRSSMRASRAEPRRFAPKNVTKLTFSGRKLAIYG